MEHNLKRVRGGRRGMAMVMYVGILLLMTGFVALGVDWGHVQMVKTQLQNAADSAARAAAATMYAGPSTARNMAVTYAANNTADGKSVVLDPNTDVDLGTWDPATRTFTVMSSSQQWLANAVRVNVTRTTAKGNAIPLSFGGILGMPQLDVRVSAIAQSREGFGVVGLNSITMSGNSSNSYWFPAGYSSTAASHGSIGSNGNITLNGSSSIQGDARPGVGKTVSSPSKVTGSTAPLTLPISMPVITAGSYATSNDNALCNDINSNNDLYASGNSHTVTMPAGNYYVHNLGIGSNAGLNVTGKATIYVYGSFNVDGDISTSANSPANLTIVMVNNNPLSISNNQAIYANIYALQSNVTLSGSGDVYGRVVGLNVNMSGSSAIHYDLSLPGVAGVTIVH